MSKMLSKNWFKHGKVPFWLLVFFFPVPLYFCCCFETLFGLVDNTSFKMINYFAIWAHFIECGMCQNPGFCRPFGVRAAARLHLQFARASLRRLVPSRELFKRRWNTYATVFYCQICYGILQEVFYFFYYKLCFHCDMLQLINLSAISHGSF